MSSFVFSISQDFPNGQVNIDNLMAEIKQSNITIVLDSIGAFGDVLTIYFKDVLSQANQNILFGGTYHPAGGLIAKHNPIPQPPPVSTIKILEEAIATNGLYRAWERMQ